MSYKRKVEIETVLNELSVCVSFAEVGRRLNISRQYVSEVSKDYQKFPRNPPGWVRVEEYATITNYSKTQICYYLCKGLLTGIRQGCIWLIPMTEVLKKKCKICSVPLPKRSSKYCYKCKAIGRKRKQWENLKRKYSNQKVKEVKDE